MLIVEYNPDWPINFQKIKKILANALQGIHVGIEHVGSTSVINLAAKPIIDIDIIYTQTIDFEQIKVKLEAIGYFHNGDQNIKGREVFKRNNLVFDEILDLKPHHLYVCKHDCWELQRHILFRDYLRKNEQARIFYQNLKYKISEEANQDRKLYAQMKELKSNSFIDYIIILEQRNYENNF